jgi:hypothetical protein
LKSLELHFNKLNKNAAGAACGERIQNSKDYLRTAGAIPGSPTWINPRTPMQRMLLPELSYLMLTSITFPAQIANNLIEYILHAEPSDKLRISRFILFK